MLKNFPILFNGNAIPFPNSYDISNSVIENVNTSEAGTDIIQIKRMAKMTLSLSFRLMDSYLAFFEGYAYSNSTITVSIYDATTKAYITKTMRMRDFSYKLVEKSELVNDINGMYDISFSLVEM